jgi:hypothetical protein
MLVLILRSAHAQALPQSRKGLRASRRMRAATVRGPSCFETHRSAAELGKHPYSFRAARLLSMRARGAAYFRRTNPRPFWPSGSSRRRAPIRWLWVPALAALGRDERSPGPRSINLRLRETIAGSLSLFPACSLQGMGDYNLDKASPKYRRTGTGRRLAFQGS